LHDLPSEFRINSRINSFIDTNESLWKNGIRLYPPAPGIRRQELHHSWQRRLRPAQDPGRREQLKDADSTHTFLFSLEDGRVIDGGSRGNDARWINHACEPNCEAREEDGRVFIYALRDIPRGEELNYNYGLILDERHTPAVKRAYACLCGSPKCRKTMLAPKRKKSGA
jgi:SET domain-containing protein